MKRNHTIKAVLIAVAVMLSAAACSLGSQTVNKENEAAAGNAETTAVTKTADPTLDQSDGAPIRPDGAEDRSDAEADRPDASAAREEAARANADQTDTDQAGAPGKTGAAAPGMDTYLAPDGREDGPEEEGAYADAFAERIQEAVADKDMEALGELISYPFRMEIPEEEDLVIKDKEEFLKLNPDLVFGDDLMVAVATVDTAELTEESGSVFLGDGETGITFSVSGGKAGGITRIHQ